MLHCRRDEQTHEVHKLTAGLLLMCAGSNALMALGCNGMSTAGNCCMVACVDIMICVMNCTSGL